MLKLITSVGFTRHAVNKFERDVNALLDKGWTVADLEIGKKGLRFVCFALLIAPEA